MTISFSDIMAHWTLRPLLLVGLGLVILLYVRGWSVYRHQSMDTETARSSPAKFALSLLVLALTMLSPIHWLAGQVFFMRIFQHLLILSLFPALFMASNPLPVLYAALPAGWQGRLKRRLGPTSTVWQIGRRLTPKAVMWFLFVATIWMWYDPSLHMLTLRYPGLRYVELITITLAALFHWWHITGAAPRLHQRLPRVAHIGYTMAGSAPLKIPGLFFLFSMSVSYAYPSAVLLGWEIDPLLSQRIGGALVWMLGGVVYSTTALGFTSHLLQDEADKPPQPISMWDNKESMLAPGIRKN